MAQEYIGRTLWYQTDDKPAEVSQSQLLERTEPLVILGEAGMGKTSLLEQLATTPGYVRCTARQLINCFNPHKLLGDARVLIIDALDEVSSAREGDSIDLVLRQLGELDYPCFILSCRVSDWRSATGLEAISEQYSEKPLELHLKPLKDNDIVAYLSSTLGDEHASKVVEHFNSRGLDELLGNPQTLEMIARVVQSGNLPETRSELFEQAIERLRVEHNETKASAALAKYVALNAAGAACAALILTGNEAITRTATAKLAEGELPLVDLSLFPGGGDIAAVIGTRLFKAGGAERFSYLHRRVGEYLGAKWLAIQANTPRKRKRLLALFHRNGLVPASLRGIHAWLARDPILYPDVVSADPMGVIEYGDVDALPVSEARVLLNALEYLAKSNPYINGWGAHSIRSFAQPAFLDDLRRLIKAADTPYGLCLMILESLKGTEMAPEFTDDLRTIVLDQQSIFRIRKTAGKALAELKGEKDWTEILFTLNAYGEEYSVRLGIELLDDIGYELCDDKLIVDLVVSYAKSGSRTIGVLMGVEKYLPESRIEGVLYFLSEAVERLGEKYKRPGNNVLTDFAYSLIVRAVTAGGVTADKLWSWLKPFDINMGYQKDSGQQLEAILQGDVSLRRAVQRLVFLELADEGNLWRRMYHLSKLSPGFTPTADDLIALLQDLDPTDRNDERWREVVQLAQHNGENGIEVRTAAHRFAAHRPDLLAWLDRLAVPRLPKWQQKQVEQDRKRRAKRAVEHAEARKYYGVHIEQMLKGEFETIITLAQVYLGLSSNINKDIPAEQRVASWLGENIANAVHLGFEAFLMMEASKPSAQEMAESLAQGQYYPSGYIIVAALAERLRKGIGFDDLSSERLMAGLFELRRSGIDIYAGIEGLREAVEEAIKARGDWERAIRIFYEPRLSAGKEHVRIDELMSSEADSNLVTSLAIEWLVRFPSLPAKPETELIDRLVRFNQFEALRRLASSRTGLTDDERRRTWDAIGLLVDFEKTVVRLESCKIEPELLWHIRYRSESYHHSNNASITFKTVQLEWIISTFRTNWPTMARPNRVSVGNKNSWDASHYITDLIHRLGNDVKEAAGDSLKRLRDGQADGYTELITVAMAERARQLVESAYTPPKLEEIGAVIADLAPASGSDLLAFMIEELEIVQAKVKSDDVDSWRGFYDDQGNPFDEERCRHYLLTLLRQEAKDIGLVPEAHAAANKKVDITCSVGQLRLPIEIKGQWHRELWTAADKQLDTLYTPDWQAGGFGIYLILWFGEQPSPKRLKGPGGGKSKPSTPVELHEMLTAESPAAREGRVKVFVLDLERP